MSTNRLISTFSGKNPGPIPFLSPREAMRLGTTCKAAYKAVISKEKFWRQAAESLNIPLGPNENPLAGIRLEVIRLRVEAAYERGYANGSAVYDNMIISTVLVALPAYVKLYTIFCAHIPRNINHETLTFEEVLPLTFIATQGLMVSNSVVLNMQKNFASRGWLFLDAACILQGVLYCGGGDFLVGTSFIFPSALHTINTALSPRRVRALCRQTCGRLRQAATRTSIYAEKTWRLPCTQRVRRASSRLFAWLISPFQKR